jgi:hypothetical protein
MQVGAADAAGTKAHKHASIGKRVGWARLDAQITGAVQDDSLPGGDRRQRPSPMVRGSHSVSSGM